MLEALSRGQNSAQSDCALVKRKVTTMRARQLPCDAQLETVPRRLLVTSCATEALENFWCAFRWNSMSVVADTDLHNVIMLFGRKQNLTAVSVVFKISNPSMRGSSTSSTSRS